MKTARRRAFPRPRPGWRELPGLRPAAGAEDAALIYEGRRVVLHRGECLKRFTERPDVLFAPLRPRGALFQEAADGSSGPTAAWMALGLYVVLGLLAGASCAYLAVGRGLSRVRWFFARLLLNAARWRAGAADSERGVRGSSEASVTLRW